jgi:AcrR family transcriptional regulator
MRAYLLQCAGEVMRARRSPDVSLGEVAQKAGHSPTLVQYHFGNKDGLLLALLERDATQAMSRMNILAVSDLPAVTKLKLHIGGLVNAYFRAPYLNRLLDDLMRDGAGPHSERVGDLFVTPLVEFQTSLLEQGVREGVFRPIPPFEFYFIVNGACDQLFSTSSGLSRCLGIGEVTDDIRRSYARTITSLVLRGIAADSTLPVERPKA